MDFQLNFLVELSASNSFKAKINCFTNCKLKKGIKSIKVLLYKSIIYDT